MVGEVWVVKAEGNGSTEVSAFDDALKNCGLEDYNLVRLSSVIPEGAEIVEEESFRPPSKIGNKLYLVYSRKISEDRSAAGIGWLNSEEGGIFVEHTAATRKEVERKIENSLEGMRKYRDREFTEKGKAVKTVEAREGKCCAFVGAIFREEKW